PAVGDTFEDDAVTEVITGIENMPGAFQDKSGGKKLTKVKVVDDGIQPTTTKGWFSGCSKLAGVEGLSKLDTSKVTNMGYMFSNCWRLTSLQLSGFDTSSVTNMGSMFNGCSGLTSLQLSSFNTTNVTDMGFMFWDCRGLTSLDVSKFDTSKVFNMGYMFLSCSGLTSLDLSSFDTSSVTNMHNMFYECSGLNKVTFPNDANSKANLQKALGDCGITLGSDEDANALSASDNMESHQCEEGVEHRNLQYEGAAPLSGSTAAAAIIAPSSNVSNAGKTEADSPGQSGGSESKEPSAEKADNCQPDSDGSLSSDKSGSSAQEK
ncbi:BspA family leucine-rich repeat surface protein, partial [Senegalimassilia anaerobia]|uniref:BspA family leucine-rich repeat surface protein n=1 Tax=Senegalimassilia anaerobia TaxID=1473216 RepID=UPI003A9775CD